MFGSLSQETAIFQNLAKACCAWHRQVNISGSWILDPQTIPVTTSIRYGVLVSDIRKLNFAAGLQI